MSKERECLLWVDAFLLGQKAIGSDGIAEIRRRVGNALRDEKWPPAWVEPASEAAMLVGEGVEVTYWPFSVEDWSKAIATIPVLRSPRTPSDNYGPRDYGP